MEFIYLELTTVLETNNKDGPQWRSEQEGDGIRSPDQFDQPSSQNEDLYEEDYTPRDEEQQMEQHDGQIIHEDEHTDQGAQDEQIEHEQSKLYYIIIVHQPHLDFPSEDQNPIENSYDHHEELSEPNPVHEEPPSQSIPEDNSYDTPPPYMASHPGPNYDYRPPNNYQEEYLRNPYTLVLKRPQNPSVSAENHRPLTTMKPLAKNFSVP